MCKQNKFVSQLKFSKKLDSRFLLTQQFVSFIIECCTYWYHWKENGFYAKDLIKNTLGWNICNV